MPDEMYVARDVTERVLYEFLVWLKSKGYEVAQDNYGGTFGGLSAVNSQLLRPLCAEWIKEKYG